MNKTIKEFKPQVSIGAGDLVPFWKDSTNETSHITYNQFVSSLLATFIVQSAGSATNKVMSQKAVTDQLLVMDVDISALEAKDLELAEDIQAVKDYADDQDAIVLQSAKDYADDQDVIVLQSSKDYTDNGLETKADLVAGVVPAAQLPSYVDDVLEFVDYASLPVTGETGKIYVLITPYTNPLTGVVSSQFRWSGSAYAEIVASPGTSDALAEGVINKYYTDARSALNEKVANKNAINGYAGLNGTGKIDFSQLDLSGTSGVSYNSATGAISLNLATGNTWTAQQSATSFKANGNGTISGYFQMVAGTAPSAVAGSALIYTDSVNGLSVVKLNGSIDRIAMLGTSQNFTAQQTFVGTHRIASLQVLRDDGITWSTALSSSITKPNTLYVGIGFSGLTIPVGAEFLSNITSGGTIISNSLTANNISNRSFGTYLSISTINSSVANSDNILIRPGTVTGAFNCGHILIDGGTSSGGLVGNLSLFNGTAIPAWNGMQRGIFIANTLTVPSGNPINGGYLYVDSGSLKYRGSSGTVTTLGNA